MSQGKSPKALIRLEACQRIFVGGPIIHFFQRGRSRVFGEK